MIRIPRPFKKKESLPTPAQSQPTASAPLPSPALTVDQLLDPLAARVSYEYVGDRKAPFRGIGLRATKKLARGQFLVLVDKNWGQRTVRKFGYRGISREEMIAAGDELGATGFVCNEDLKGAPVLEGKNCFFVPNTLDFAFRLVESVRELSASKVIAITGSAGKTTTKGMITHVLESLVEPSRLYSPPGTDNIFTSVTSQLSRAANFDYSVLEVAGSCFLRFHKNNFAVSPDVSIVTSISEAHLDYLDSLEGVARRKSRLFDRPPRGGTAVINLDTACADQLVEHAQSEGCRVVTYGESPEAMVRLTGYDPVSRQVRVLADGVPAEFTIGADGKHMALNSLAVLATLRALEVPGWRSAMASLASFRALVGRGQQSTVTLASGGELTLIDESYNANPASMRAALQALGERPVPDGGRRIVVLGDMLELGADAAAIHRGLADSVAALTGAQVHLVGEKMAELFTELDGRLPGVRHWSDLEALTAVLLADLAPGDFVLLKGSNSMHLGTIVKALRGVGATSG